MEDIVFKIAVQDNLSNPFSRSSLTMTRGFLPLEEYMV